MTAYFLSDLHLSGPTDSKAHLLENFLRKIRSDLVAGELSSPVSVFLVGDIFDLWIASHGYFQNSFKGIIEAVSELIDVGVSVHVFEGNHDLYMKPFWQNTLGAKVHEDAATFQLGEKIVRVEHGDLMNPEDRGYLFLRWFLRTPVMKLIARSLPEKFVTLIGERASRASRTYTSTAKELPKDKIRAIIRAHAERVLAEEPFDLLVSGHVHVRDDQSIIVGSRSARSINLGSWFDNPAVLKLDEKKVEFIELDS